jgi:hypothetical protein
VQCMSTFTISNVPSFICTLNESCTHEHINFTFVLRCFVGGRGLVVVCTDILILMHMCTTMSHCHQQAHGSCHLCHTCCSSKGINIYTLTTALVLHHTQKAQF